MRLSNLGARQVHARGNRRKVCGDGPLDHALRSCTEFCTVAERRRHVNRPRPKFVGGPCWRDEQGLVGSTPGRKARTGKHWAHAMASAQCVRHLKPAIAQRVRTPCPWLTCDRRCAGSAGYCKRPAGAARTQEMLLRSSWRSASSPPQFARSSDGIRGAEAEERPVSSGAWELRQELQASGPGQVDVRCNNGALG